MNAPIDEKGPLTDVRLSTQPELIAESESPEEICSSTGENTSLPNFADNLETIAHIRADQFGNLYRVRDNRLNQEFFVRVLGQAQLPTEETRKSFVRFCKRYTTITHPFLPPIYSFNEGADSIWIVSDVCDGKSLQEMMDCGDFKAASKISSIFGQLAECVDLMNQVGIRFGAVHPNSIIVEEGPAGSTVKIRDWWCSAIVQAQGVHSLPEQMRYASPEHIDDAAKIDVRSDVYCLGVLLYEALTGHLHVETDNPVKVAVKILAADSPAVDGPFSSHALAEITRRCLARDPGKRYQSLDVLCDDLKSAARGTPISKGEDPNGLAFWKTRKLFTYLILVGIACTFFAQSHHRSTHSDSSDLQRDAFDAEQVGDLSTAESLLRASLSTDPNDAYAWYNLGRIEAKVDQLDAAQKALLESVALDPSFSYAHHELGKVKYEKGDYAGAVNDYQKAIQFGDFDTELLPDLTLAYSKLGKHDLAIETAKQAMKQEPENLTLSAVLGNAYLQAGKLKEAETAYRNAVKADNEDVRAVAGLAETLDKMGNHPEAAKLRLQLIE